MTSLEFWYTLNRGYRAHNVPEKRFLTSFCARNEVFWLILESLFFNKFCARVAILYITPR